MTTPVECRQLDVPPANDVRVSVQALTTLVHMHYSYFVLPERVNHRLFSCNFAFGMQNYNRWGGGGHGQEIYHEDSGVCVAECGPGGTSDRMIYGPAAYAAHARLIPAHADPEGKRYKWLEHVLIWRLDALCLARAYAVMYLQDNAGLLAPAKRKHVETAVQEYCKLLGLVASGNIFGGEPPARIGPAEISLEGTHVRIFDSENSRKWHAELFWSENGETQPLREVLATAQGRQRFADWLLKVQSAEERAISALTKVLE